MFVVHQNKNMATEVKDIHYDSIWRDEPKDEQKWVIYINGINYGEFDYKIDVVAEYHSIIVALGRNVNVYKINGCDRK